MRKMFQAILVTLVCIAFAWSEGGPSVVKKPGEELVNSIGMKFRLIQPGSFMMGSEKGDDDEKPVHKVTLTKGFYIGVYEVTQEEWEKVMGSNPSDFKGPKNPVDTVSWEDAQEFIRKLSEKEKVTYRLPTEAEWEYACRAGTTTRFYWGDDADDREIGDYAWYYGNLERTKIRTKPVGQKKPNAWRLYDMSGNVYEWCQDWYADKYPLESQIDPTGPTSGSDRVVRGGCWDFRASYCRSAVRSWDSPSRRGSGLGFRLVRMVTDTGPLAPRRPVVAPDAGHAVSPPSATLPGAQTEELVNTIGMKFRVIQPGSFMMGSDKGDSDEKPVHKVTLTKGFYIGVYEVTQEEWEKVMGSNPSNFKGPKNPVENVSWEDAQEFVRKLSQKEKVTYRLPTEAEWEYACRAGTTTRFYWGDDADDREIGDYAWYYGNLERTKIGTKPVGQKKPNAWGLYDMSGNVYEWCQDWYADKYPLESQIDPTGPKSGSDRVVRGGGCWDGSASYCRSADRGRLSPSDRGSRVGFRLVRTIP